MATRAKSHLQDLRDKGIIPPSDFDYEQKRLSVPQLALAKKIRSSSRWQRARRAFIARHPICSNPLGLHDGQVRPTAQVHHKKEIGQYPELAFVEENLEPVCTECHAAIEQKNRRNI
jgi:5-methylcytosine-specific restriction endonuclease McrA